MTSDASANSPAFLKSLRRITRDGVSSKARPDPPDCLLGEDRRPNIRITDIEDGNIILMVDREMRLISKGKIGTALYDSAPAVEAAIEANKRLRIM